MGHTAAQPRQDLPATALQMWLLVLLVLLLFGGGAFVVTSNLLLVVIVALLVMAVSGYAGRGRWRS